MLAAVDLSLLTLFVLCSTQLLSRTKTSLPQSDKSEPSRLP
jgi:hypothetical protein